MDIERATIMIAGFLAMALVRWIHILCRDLVRVREWEPMPESDHEWIDDEPVREILTADERGVVSYDAEITRAA